ncbi:MAG TPA: VOC family protein [Acidimicrobiales bacterium]|nr:VOC family protein [Acidimicrobiales bacterium]
MLVRDHYPAGTPSWVETTQPDPVAAAAFYGALFGWTFNDRMPPDAPGQYLVAHLEDLDVAAVGSQSEGTPPTAMWHTYVTVDSADDTAARVSEAGGAVISEPFDVFDVGRMAVVADPAGATFCLWQPGSFHGAEVVNAPGSWNWSNLATGDPEGAKAFYAAVFGWEARTISLGGFEATMFCLPDYGDFLATLEPGLRERQADQGAPEGFADAIAWLETTTSDEVPAHWSVTFSATDTRATASLAARLGGTVIVPPFDAGNATMATLTDPAGAVFTVNTYTPPS